jgi:hypothetical protein
MLHSYLASISLPNKAKNAKRVQIMLDNSGLEGTTSRLFQMRQGLDGVRYALSSENSEVIEALANHAKDYCRNNHLQSGRWQAYWNQTPVVMPLLETLGKQQDNMSEAVSFAYESINLLKQNRVYSNHGVDNLYLFVNRPDAAIDVRLADGKPSDAKHIADSLLSGSQQSFAYRRIFDAIPQFSPNEYHRGLETKVNIANILNDPKLISIAETELAAYLKENPVSMEPVLPVPMLGHSFSV